MNGIIRPSKEEQFYAYPNDMGFWADKKRALAKPFADITERYFLNTRIHERISHIKKNNPALVLGETH